MTQFSESQRLAVFVRWFVLVACCAHFVGLIAGFTDRLCADDQIVAPVVYGRGQLENTNPRIRALALCIVASPNPKAEKERLLQSLKDPSRDVQMASLRYLCHVSLGKDSVKLHAYLDKAAADAKAALAARSKSAEPFICEMSAVEVLLAAGNEADRRSAHDYIARALADPFDYTRWLMMADFIKDYKLNDLVSLLKSNVPSKEPQSVLLAMSLAKLGDKGAIEFLHRSLNDPTWRPAILRDPELVKIFDLKEKDILPYLKSASFDERVAAATASARFGNCDALRELLAKAWLGDSADPTSKKWVHAERVLASVGDVGDESFRPLLNEYFDKSKDEELKLNAALCIVRISARQRKAHDADRQR